MAASGDRSIAARSGIGVIAVRRSAKPPHDKQERSLQFFRTFIAAAGLVAAAVVAPAGRGRHFGRRRQLRLSDLREMGRQPTSKRPASA